MWLRKGVFRYIALLLITGGLQADITITQLANEGAIISDGKTRVMIDGMVVEPYSVYGGLPPAAAAQFSDASGPFSGIDLALVSHRHHDHNQPRFACEFMRVSAKTMFVSSPQVLGLMREKCRELVTTDHRFHEILPQYGQPGFVERGGARVTVFLLSHGTRKYARIQNFGHLIRIGGMSVLHLGDAAMSPEDFERAGLHEIKVDVAMIPFWYFQPGPGAELIKKYLNAPVKLAVHIPPGEMQEVSAYLAEAYPTVQVPERPLQEIRFSSDTLQPPP